MPNPWKARMRLKAQRIVFEACGAEVSSTKRMLAARIRGDEVFKFGDVAVAPLTPQISVLSLLRKP